MHEHRHGPTGAGTVLLELGAGVGAILLQVPVELAGREIEISRTDVPGLPRTHAQVRERPADGRVTYSALYAGLAEGSYAVWRDESTAALSVTVTGGQVTSCHWPAAAGSAERTGPVCASPGNPGRLYCHAARESGLAEWR
jgi:hypothetical protein